MAAITFGENYSYDPASAPPAFGHALKKYWAFHYDYVNLNHGSFGSQPLPVFAESVKLQLQSEQVPDEFHRKAFAPLLVESRRQVAALVGAKLTEIVLVPNTTHGLNTVLRNFEWRDGDILLGANISYAAIAGTMRYLADRSESPRPTYYDVSYTFPMTHQQVIDAFRARVREIKQLHFSTEFTDTPGSEGKGNKFVAVVDAIAATPGVAMPWKALVKICAEEGIWGVVDGAHAIGQEVDINLTEVKPDFWVSNCHKWLYTKRSCAALYVPERNQYIIKSSIPTPTAYLSRNEVRTAGSPSDFESQHSWTATLDLSPFLSVVPALKFRAWLGGEFKINTYCHDLAIKGGQLLADVLQTRVMDESGELTWNMTNVQLPLPIDSSDKPSVYTPKNVALIDTTIRDKMLHEWNLYVAHYFHAGGWWVRASTQVFNEISDFEYLGKALIQICKEVREDILEKA